MASIGQCWTTGQRGEQTGLWAWEHPILFCIASIRHGSNSKWWGTYRQWGELGCQVEETPDNVEPGQWGAGIVFFKPIRKTVVDDDETGEEQEESFGVLRTYTVFNADQVSGAERSQ